MNVSLYLGLIILFVHPWADQSL